MQGKNGANTVRICEYFNAAEAENSDKKRVRILTHLLIQTLDVGK